MADPQFIGALLVPGNASLGAVDVYGEHIFSSGRHLADGECAARTIAQAQQRGAKVVGIDLDHFELVRFELLASKCSTEAFGFRRVR